MDSRRLARLIRSILARDFAFEAPSRRRSTGAALFLAGMGAGVLVGVMLAPSSSPLTDRFKGEETRDGEVANHPKKALGESIAPSRGERSA